MIYGIGTDLVDLERIKSMKSLSSFAKKILGDQELKEYAQLEEGLNQYYLGKQFAGKEAFVKALGTGFKDPIFPKDIQILRNSLGKPEVILSAGAKSYVEDLGITKSHVSLADESNHLIAFAVLET
ncbi:MAG: holo-ACP synthase [Gammaproteobacteria bacterium]|jgi:holo-[acyl-carrier protein] synthase|tara:strand:+ start:291 stop:668 length:378 start_codon:yes stop_codon:yes gene_type:complete